MYHHGTAPGALRPTTPADLAGSACTEDAR